MDSTLRKRMAMSRWVPSCRSMFALNVLLLGLTTLNWGLGRVCLLSSGQNILVMILALSAKFNKGSVFIFKADKKF